MEPDQAGTLRILYVLRCLGVGGLEKQLLLLIRHLRHRGHACHVFSLEEGGCLMQTIQREGVAVRTGRMASGELFRAPWKLLAAEGGLAAWTRSLKPHVVHAFLPLVSLMGAAAGKLCRVPLVVTGRRALGTHQERYPALRFADRLSHRLSDRVTVNSRAVWQDTLLRDHLPSRKIVLIHNGVETEPFDRADKGSSAVRRALQIPPGHRVAITVANLIPYKGHADLLEAAAAVVARVPQTVFLFAGEDRGLQASLEQRAASLGILGHVRFLGLRTDIPALLAASDVAVLASHEEGFSNSLLEAMAAGLPVVATCVGGNPEAVVEGETGWLVPPGDPGALADRLADLLENPARARAWGRSARARVERCFSVEKAARLHEDLYFSALRGGP